MNKYPHIRFPKKPAISRKGISDVVPGFIYPIPTYNKFPLLEIVQELEKRDFRVPNIQIKFSFSGYGKHQFKYVSTIDCDDIHMFFCFKQGSVPGYESKLNDIAGLNECHIEGHSVHFYGDSSGTPYLKYIGNNWKRDMKEFRKMQFESDKKPHIRTYSKYITSSERELFIEYLQTFIDYIKTFPETRKRVFTESLCETEDDFQRTLFENYPENYPTLYVKHDPFRIFEELERFDKGFNNIPDSEKTASLGGQRLVHWSTFSDTIKIHSLATDGFAWAFVNEEKLQEMLKQYEGWKYDDILIYVVRPHYLDDIYVADLSIAEKYRSDCFKTTKCLSNEQYDDYIALRGVKVVTLKEYIESKLEFEIPQYLIHKPIGYDEIQRIYHIKRNEPMECHDKIN